MGVLVQSYSKTLNGQPVLNDVTLEFLPGTMTLLHAKGVLAEGASVIGVESYFSQEAANRFRGGDLSGVGEQLEVLVTGVAIEEGGVLQQKACTGRERDVLADDFAVLALML